MKALQAENELLERFKTELARASKFYLGMALVTQSGLERVLPSMERSLERRGRGYVLFGIDLPTDPDAIQSLCTLQIRHKENFEVRRFQPGERFFHPKVSVFVGRTGAKTAIVGSSNLTGGGLSENHETNVFLNDRRVVQKFLDYFEEHFQERMREGLINVGWISIVNSGSSEKKQSAANERCVRKLAALVRHRRMCPIGLRVMRLHLQGESPDGLASESCILAWNGAEAAWQRVSLQPSALSTLNSWAVERPLASL